VRSLTRKVTNNNRLLRFDSLLEGLVSLAFVAPLFKTTGASKLKQLRRRVDELASQAITVVSQRQTLYEQIANHALLTRIFDSFVDGCTALLSNQTVRGSRGARTRWASGTYSGATAAD